MPPLVSVLLPVYNTERYLASAVESILYQSLSEFELIIIDDGSTDGSLSILQSYAAQDRRIRLISRENRGLIATLNQMLELANADFLARMDADDIATPDRLRLQVNFLQQHPEVVCVGGAYDLIDPQGRRVQWILMPEQNDEIQRMLLIGRTIINHPCAMIRRAAMRQIGGYDAEMKTVEDLDLLLRLGEVGQLANLPETVLQYRFHTDSVSAKNILYQTQMAKQACQQAWQRRGVSGHYDAPQPWYRPTPDPDSQQQFFERYGWWAFCCGWRGTAVRCGVGAVRAKPTMLESWKLLVCALIKPIPLVNPMMQMPHRSAQPPTLSVLLPVYNAQRYVAQAVESILNQSWRDFELLIIDDGSSDRSLKILQRYAAQDPRIRLISRANRGFVKTLNELLELATGEFVARMDADDVAMPHRFTAQVKFLRQHPEVVCVGGAQDWIDPGGRFLLHHPEATEDTEIQALALTGQTPINHPSAMMRRSALLQVGGYDEALYPSEDLDLWLKLGEIGKLANLEQTVTQYRQHNRSISERLQTLQTQQRRNACQRAWQRRGVSGRFHEAPPWRPVDRPSRYRFITMHGWWFFNAGKRTAALIYSFKAISTLPWETEGWKLLACSLLKKG